MAQEQEVKLVRILAITIANKST